MTALAAGKECLVAYSRNWSVKIKGRAGVDSDNRQTLEEVWKVLMMTCDKISSVCNTWCFSERKKAFVNLYRQLTLK